MLSLQLTVVAIKCEYVYKLLAGCVRLSVSLRNGSCRLIRFWQYVVFMMFYRPVYVSLLRNIMRMI